jgi:hypothetical protein
MLQELTIRNFKLFSEEGVSLRSVLATTDGPCRLALISNGIDQKYQLVVATPAEALAMAGPSDP